MFAAKCLYCFPSNAYIVLQPNAYILLLPNAYINFLNVVAKGQDPHGREKLNCVINLTAKNYSAGGVVDDDSTDNTIA